MAAAAMLDNFEWPYLRNGGREDLTTLCPRKIHVTTFVTFLADRTNGRAYATVLRLSVVCDVMYCG